MNSKLSICLTLAVVTCLCSAQISAQTTLESSTDSPSQTAGGMRALRAFVPDDAELIVAVDLDKLRDDQLLSWWISWTMLESQIPREPGKVDLMVLAGTATALQYVSNDYESTFAELAAELNGTPVPQPTGIDIKLNQRMAGLLHFEHPVLSFEVVNWLSDSDDQSRQYEAVRENGWEVFRCANENSCLAVRIDDRTLIVGGRPEIEQGLQRLASVNYQPNDFAMLVTPRLATRKAAVLVNMQSIQGDLVGQGQNDLENLMQARSLRIELDHSPLLQVRASYADSKVASAAIGELASLLQRHIGDMRNSWTAVRNDDAELDWLATNGLKTLESLQVGMTGSDVVVILPRPDNWEEIMERLVAFRNRAMAEARSAFEETARQLEEATNAAAEAAQFELEDVAGQRD